MRLALRIAATLVVIWVVVAAGTLSLCLVGAAVLFGLWPETWRRL